MVRDDEYGIMDYIVRHSLTAPTAWWIEKENKRMFVAVVYKYHADTDPQSHKDHGGWESFLGHTKEEAVNQALLWARRWEAEPKFDAGSVRNTYYGPYRVLVGELTEEAKTNAYTLATFAPAEAW